MGANNWRSGRGWGFRDEITLSDPSDEGAGSGIWDHLKAVDAWLVQQAIQ